MNDHFVFTVTPMSVFAVVSSFFAASFLWSKRKYLWERKGKIVKTIGLSTMVLGGLSFGGNVLNSKISDYRNEKSMKQELFRDSVLPVDWKTIYDNISTITNKEYRDRVLASYIDNNRHSLSMMPAEAIEIFAEVCSPDTILKVMNFVDLTADTKEYVCKN